MMHLPINCFSCLSSSCMSFFSGYAPCTSHVDTRRAVPLQVVQVQGWCIFMKGNCPVKAPLHFSDFRTFRGHPSGFSGQSCAGDPTKARSHHKTGIFMKRNRPLKAHLHFSDFRTFREACQYSENSVFLIPDVVWAKYSPCK